MSQKDNTPDNALSSEFNEAETVEPVASSYEELQKQLAAEKEKATQYWDRLLRQQAEKENLERRAERDIASAHKYALEKFVLALLPIVDGLERAVTAYSTEKAESGSLLDGVNMTLKMFYTTLEKFGVQQVDPQGQAFNHEFHEAVSTQIDCDTKPGSVISVLQKGYTLNNRLVRPALVIVAK
ncbi:MAG: hypothetical protein K0R24_1472 [Gammaproteobacteria bacterium]|nr:hypothetical protein [Gammaproteobacteria bacterium]MCE3238491.1 hypothetical protein [Gammaproteobacteria bacterium]